MLSIICNFRHMMTNIEKDNLSDSCIIMEKWGIEKCIIVCKDNSLILRGSWMLSIAIEFVFAHNIW